MRLVQRTTPLINGKHRDTITIECRDAPITHDAFTLSAGAGLAIEATIENVVYTTRLVTPLCVDLAYGRLMSCEDVTIDDGHWHQKKGSQVATHNIFSDVLIESGCVSDEVRRQLMQKTLSACNATGERSVMNMVVAGHFQNRSVSMPALQKLIPGLIYNRKTFQGASLSLPMIEYAYNKQVSTHAPLFTHPVHATVEDYCKAQEAADLCTAELLQCTVVPSPLKNTSNVVIYPDGSLLMVGHTDMRQITDALHKLLVVIERALQ